MTRVPTPFLYSTLVERDYYKLLLFPGLGMEGDLPFAGMFRVGDWRCYRSIRQLRQCPQLSNADIRCWLLHESRKGSPSRPVQKFYQVRR